MVNDMTIIGGFIFFFIALGSAMPFIQADFEQDQSITNVNKSLEKLETAVEEVSPTNGWKILFSVITMPLWSFGGVPWSINVFLLLPIRIVFWLIIARNIWIGGGS